MAGVSLPWVFSCLAAEPGAFGCSAGTEPDFDGFPYLLPRGACPSFAIVGKITGFLHKYGIRATPHNGARRFGVRF